ncbi:Myosin-binding protein H, partial [Calypte anna]
PQPPAMTGKDASPAPDPAPEGPKKETAPSPGEEPAPAPGAEEAPSAEQPPASEQPPAPTDESSPAPTAEETPTPAEGPPAPEPEPEKPKAGRQSRWRGLVGGDGQILPDMEKVLGNMVSHKELSWVSTDWKAVNEEPFLSTRYTIKDLSPGEKIHVRVKAVSAHGASVPTTLEQPVLIQEILQLPKIRMPRHLRQTYFRHVGDAVNIMIPFLGKPQPEVIWTKNGQPLNTSRVNTRNSQKDTIFFIREAQRGDSGKYELSVRINGAEDKAILDIQVIEPPGPPQNLKLVDVWAFNVALEWSPPADNGNSDIKGYLVQKSDKKSGKWFTVLDRCTRTSCTISDLIIGNSYTFRVFAENSCGMSEQAAVSGVAEIKKPKISYQVEKLTQRELMEPPKFTQPLTDRSTTRGYSTHLICCVRGFPQPKIIWLKNQVEIREDPKYIALIEQGICSLEIRKPGPFDGGVYTCKAVNPLGEASVNCRLDVK